MCKRYLKNLSFINIIIFTISISIARYPVGGSVTSECRTFVTEPITPNKTSAASVLKDPVAGYQEGDRFFYFPGDDNVLRLVDTQEPVDEEFLSYVARNPDDNVYSLYTRNHPTQGQRIHFLDAQSLLATDFNPAKTTVFIAHGWNGNGQNRLSVLLTSVFLLDDDVNVIVLDWSRLANRNYLTARNGVPAVGRHVGQFINWIVHAFGASYDRIHLVGFSLGGHLMGNAGRETGSLVRRITALDPAGPGWGNNDRLTEADARYVEVIHTNTFFLGYRDPCGHADFYPNGGSNMPGCWTNTCSHGMAVDYMAASVTHNHLLANECFSYSNASRDRCTGTLFPMGNSDLNKSRSGIFRVNTGRNYPF